MTYVSTIEEMEKIIRENMEVVLCGYSVQSKFAIDFFKQRDLQRRISCIASLAEYNAMIMDSYEDKAVFFLGDMVVFWQTAMFLICDNNSRHNLWVAQLQQYGCKNIYIVKKDVHDEIKRQLAEDRSWELNKLREELSEVKLIMAEQNELCELHKKTFAEYENCFLGRDVVLVGTGPSVRYYKPIKNAIHIGVNQAWRKEGVIFDFLFTQDASNGNRDLIAEGFDRISKTIFMGRYFRRCKDNWIEYPEKYELRDNIKRYFTDPSEGGAWIYPNILYHPLRDYYGVAFPALHFALFTHPKRIFLVGLDTGSGNVSHFYNSNDISLAVSGILKTGYLKYKKFASQRYPDVDIYSINPVGLKGLFQDIYSEDNPNEVFVRPLIPELSIRVPENSRIALYGAGDQGKRFYDILRKAKNIHICNWVDMDYAHIGFPVNNPESLRELDKDNYVLIAIEREEIVQKVKQYLNEIGISKERIIWFPDTPKCG